MLFKSAHILCSIIRSSLLLGDKCRKQTEHKETIQQHENMWLEASTSFLHNMVFTVKQGVLAGGVGGWFLFYLDVYFEFLLLLSARLSHF